MKLLTLFGILILSLPAAAQDSVTICGIITNPASDSIKIKYNDDPIAYFPREFYAIVDKNGNFAASFPVPHGIYIQTEVTTGDHLIEMVLRAGDSLTLTCDTRHFDSTVHYTGKGSDIQNFIARHSLIRGRMNQYTLKIKSDIIKEPADFIKSIALEKKSETDLLQKYGAGLPQSFVQYWTAYYQYYNYFFLQQYPQVHEMVKLRKYTDTVPRANYSVAGEMAYAFYDSLIQVPSYLLYLTGIFDFKLKAAGYVYIGKDKDKINAFQDSVNKLAWKALPDKSAEYYAAQNIYGRTRYQEMERTRIQFKAFKKRWPHSRYLPDLNRQIDMVNRLEPGMPAPDFTIRSRDGHDTLLSDLRGNVVYVVFWAGWCKQCVGEMMNLKKVKELIRNKPLKFVYVSINSDTAADYNIIRKTKMDGMFTNVAGEWNAKEVKDYGVQALPAYFLIDEEGKFAVRNAPSPLMSTELILAIEKQFH